MDIHQILDKAKKLKIGIVGDFILDKYVYGDVHRISPEAPVQVLNKSHVTEALGGAANVWQNLINLGVDAHLFCDAHIEMVGYHPNWHVQVGAHSVKTRVMAGNHHLLRIDEEPASNEIVWPIFKDVSWANEFTELLPTFDAVIISDYRKGVVSKSVAEMVVAMCNDAQKPVIVDAKDNFGRFGGATILKCNKKEWDGRDMTIEEITTDFIVVTRGEAGITVYHRNKMAFDVAGHKVNIVDVCGAGDTVTAIIGLCVAMLEIVVGDTVELANIAASEVVMHPGIFAINEESLIRRFNEVNPTTNG